MHCHHCGKEVEIITALDDTERDILAQESTTNIVKPPADFADTPEGTRQPQRIYKKSDRRLRSEERHGERKHYRNRQESARAKVYSTQNPNEICNSIHFKNVVFGIFTFRAKSVEKMKELKCNHCVRLVPAPVFVSKIPSMFVTFQIAVTIKASTMVYISVAFGFA